MIRRFGSEAFDYASEKWGGHPHYRGLAHHIGDDEHGSWLWGPAGRTIYRGDVELFVTEFASLTLVPENGWWAAAWWPGHGDIDVYVNINTPAAWRTDTLTCVDLDLDVIRFRDGRVEVVDREEFDLHKERYGYPADLIDSAETAASAVFDLVVRYVTPFDGVAAQLWLERALER